MAPRAASRNRGHGAAVDAPASSSSGPRHSSSKATMMPLAELNLLQHINGIRQVPNFTAFNIFTQSTGIDWMDGMLAQAKTIRKQWETEYIVGSREQHGTQAARIAGEMLKSPSRKRSANARVQGRIASRKLAKESAALYGSDNKENASTSALFVKPDAPVDSVGHDASEHSAGAARSTRSRADKSQIAKLPNPFQAKSIQAKTKSAKGTGEAVMPNPSSAAEAQVEKGPDEVAANVWSQSEPKDKDKDAMKAPIKLTKKQQTELKKKEAAAAKKAVEQKRETTETASSASNQPKMTKGRGKARQQQTAEEKPSAEAVRQATPPTRAMRSPERQNDESMQVDATFAEGLLTDQPQASTPTGKKASSRLLEKMLADEGISPIADEDEDSDAPSAGDEETADPTEAVTKSIETTMSLRNDQTGSAVSTSTSDTNSGNAAALNMAAPPPKQKRTLASFGGSKKSLAYGLQSQPSSTPAHAGFKSSFLNKSLRKAQKAGYPEVDGVEDEDDENDEDDSMIGTKANTQANAAAMLGVKTNGYSASRTDAKETHEEETISRAPAASSLPARSAGLKRKSDEMENANGGMTTAAQTDGRALAPKLARTLSDRSDENVGSSSAPAKAASSTTSSKIQESKLPTTSNLLRTKLESARLQKSTNTGVVGLGAKGLSSPILGRAVPASTSARSAPANGPRPSGTTVASLRGQWEAKTQSTRASPRKSSSSTPKTAAPSEVPLVSTTPLNSPAKPVRPAAPRTATKEPTPVVPAAAVSAAPALSIKQTTVSLVDEIKAVEAELGMASSSLHQTDTNVSELMAGSFDHDDTTSTLHDDDADADDESEDKGDKGKTATKVVRPLSAAVQSTHSQSRATGSDGTTTQGTKSGSYFSGKEASADSDGDDDEFTLEELEGKRSSASASAASTAVIKTTILPSAVVSGSKPVEGAPGATQWGTKLKSLFNINGVPSVPPPGPAFQPKTSRTLSTSVSAQNDIAPREMQAAPTLGMSTLSGAGGKAAGAVRADQLRRKEAEDAESRMKEQEEKRKQLTVSKASMTKAKAEEEREKERKKRAREEEERTVRKAENTPSQPSRQVHQAGTIGGSVGQLPKARLVGQFGGAAANGGPAPSAKLKASAALTSATSGGNGVMKDDGGKKRRLSKEKDEGSATRQAPSSIPNGVAKGLAGPSSIRPVGASSNTASGPPRQIKPAVNGPSRPQPQSQSQPSGGSRPPMAQQGSNFSQHNPFQQSQRSTAGAGLPQHASRPVTALALQQQQQRAQQQPIVPPSPAVCLDDNDVSLPSIVSEYSDSEDEATQARRARAAPWTKGDALQRALQEQQAVDADLIFGIPQGSVDLETLMPAESASAKARLGRPRTSSANWSGADGLKQWEIDRYNERMNIGGPGYRLPAGNKGAHGLASGSGSAGAAGGAANGRLGPNGQDHRRSVLAIGAAAQHRAQQQQQQQHTGHRP